MNHTIRECMEEFEVKNDVFIPIAVCVAGQYLDEGNRCVSCDVGSFQDSPFHKEATCKNCTSRLPQLTSY